MPPNTMFCAHCGTRYTANVPSPRSRTVVCARCGKFMPLRGKLEGKNLCVDCERAYAQEIAAANEKEDKRKALFVSQVIARHPELRNAVMHRLGLKEFSGRFHVDYNAYLEICAWDACVTDAKNFELARRDEDAALKYESIGWWKEAGRVREKKSATTVKHVNVNLNDLIDKLRSGGLSIPYKCGSCGASIVFDRNASADALKFCSYCGSAINTDLLLTLLQDAMK